MVVGWVVYRTLRRIDTTSISDIATVLGAIGGAVITGIFDTDEAFGYYGIGLAGGFFGYLLISLIVGKDNTIAFLRAEDGTR